LLVSACYSGQDGTYQDEVGQGASRLVDEFFDKLRNYFRLVSGIDKVVNLPVVRRSHFIQNVFAVDVFLQVPNLQSAHPAALADFDVSE